MNIDVIDEIQFYLATLKKVTGSASDTNRFYDRLKSLYLSGDVSKECYEALVALQDKPKGRPYRTMDDCGIVSSRC